MDALTVLLYIYDEREPELKKTNKKVDFFMFFHRLVASDHLLFRRIA